MSPSETYGKSVSRVKDVMPTGIRVMEACFSLSPGVKAIHYKIKKKSCRRLDSYHHENDLNIVFKSHYLLNALKKA